MSAVSQRRRRGALLGDQRARATGRVRLLRVVVRLHWHGERYEFESASVFRLEQGGISSIREHTITAPLYDWEGSWS